MVVEEIWVSKICLLFKNIDFSLLVKSLGEQLYLNEEFLIPNIIVGLTISKSGNRFV